jgi:protein-tyrosine phosphatase
MWGIDMSTRVLIDPDILTDIADAIRSKTGGSASIAPSAMSAAILSISGRESLSWHQCPSAVRDYIAAAQAAYPSNDNVTVIDDYAPAKGSELDSNTKPIGYTVDGVTYHNNEPSVAVPFATTNKAGTLTALDALRWINSTSAATASGETYPRGKNCRDIGGWSADGGTVRYGLLFRGGEPNPVDADLMVGKLGIMTEVQLLPVSEQAPNYKMKSVWGIDWAGNDTQSDSVYTINDSKTLWRKLIEPIMDSVIHHKPVLFHCGVGADRTGIIAIALESILGMSKSDIDIEYELTNFSTGWQSLTGGIYRARTYTAYQAMVTAVNNVPLATGLTASWRNRWVSHLLSCGISIDKINAFRSAMIDGTPETITVSLPSYTITNTLTHASTNNAATSIDQYQPYEATVSADAGYTLDSVIVTMGGVDISASAVSGNTINIASVTGNLVITATATAIVRENLLTMNDGLINKRLNSSGVTTGNGYFTTDHFPFDYTTATGIRIADVYAQISGLGTTANYDNCRIELCDSTKTRINFSYISRIKGSGNTLFSVDGNDLVAADLAENYSTAATITWANVKYIRLTLALNNAAAAIGSVSDVTNSGIKIYAE